MPSAQLPILQTILNSWTDAFRAIRDMPLVAACALALRVMIAVAVFFSADAILLNPGRTVQEWVASPAWFVFGVLNTSVRIVLLAPLVIAVLRYVIRADRATRYPLNPLRPSYLQFTGTALAIYFAFRLPELIGVLLTPAREFLIFDLLFSLLMSATMIAVAVVALTRITLFAAIAINAPNASWRTTPEASAGNVLRIVVILAGIIGPAEFVSWLAHTYLPTPQWPGGTGRVVTSLVVALIDLPVLCALAAAVARIYVAIGVADAAAPAVDAGRPAIV